MATAQQKLDKINEALAEGATIYFSTMTRHYKITQKTVARFAKAGMPLLKVSGDSLYMASGRSYLCMDYCGITREG